jgi:hypothetical protein
MIFNYFVMMKAVAPTYAYNRRLREVNRVNPVFLGKKYCILWMDWYVDQKVHSHGTPST